LNVKAGEWLRMPLYLRMIHLRRAALETKRRWKRGANKKTGRQMTAQQKREEIS